MAKYSFDNTVGELMSAPEVKPIIRELFGQYLSHPMIRMARNYKFRDVVGYVRPVVGEAKIEAFRQALMRIS